MANTIRNSETNNDLWLGRDHLFPALKAMHPRTRVAFVVRCGMRIRGLMQHPVVQLGTDMAMRLGRYSCLMRELPAELFANFTAIKKGLDKITIEGVEDPYSPTSTGYFVEDVAVARVFDSVRYYRQGNDHSAVLNAHLAIGHTEDAILWMESTAAENRRWIRALHQSLRQDLDRSAKIAEETRLEPGESGPFGTVWANETPSWYVEAEQFRPLYGKHDKKVVYDNINYVVRKEVQKAASDVANLVGSYLPKSDFSNLDAVDAVEVELKRLQQPMVELVQAWVRKYAFNSNMAICDRERLVRRLAGWADRYGMQYVIDAQFPGMPLKYANVLTPYDGMPVNLSFVKATGDFRCREPRRNGTTPWTRDAFPPLRVEVKSERIEQETTAGE